MGEPLALCTITFRQAEELTEASAHGGMIEGTLAFHSFHQIFYLYPYPLIELGEESSPVAPGKVEGAIQPILDLPPALWGHGVIAPWMISP